MGAGIQRKPLIRHRAAWATAPQATDSPPAPTTAPSPAATPIPAPTSTPTPGSTPEPTATAESRPTATTAEPRPIATTAEPRPTATTAEPRPTATTAGDDIAESYQRRTPFVPLDNPVFIPPEQATFLTPDDRVLGLTIEGESRAYPFRMMTYHHIANDTIAGRPVLVTF